MYQINALDQFDVTDYAGDVSNSKTQRRQTPSSFGVLRFQMI